MKSIEVPFFIKDEEFCSYLNFLKLQDMLIMPGYGGDETAYADAKRILEEAFQRKAERIDCTELVQQGGMVNCVTREM